MSDEESRNREQEEEEEFTDELEELAKNLDAAGVTPEDLKRRIEYFDIMQAAGVGEEGMQKLVDEVACYEEGDRRAQVFLFSALTRAVDEMPVGPERVAARERVDKLYRAQFMRGIQAITPPPEVLAIYLTEPCHKNGKTVPGRADVKMSDGQELVVHNATCYNDVMYRMCSLGYNTANIRARVREWERTGVMPPHPVSLRSEIDASAAACRWRRWLHELTGDDLRATIANRGSEISVWLADSGKYVLTWSDNRLTFRGRDSDVVRNLTLEQVSYDTIRDVVLEALYVELDEVANKLRILEREKRDLLKADAEHKEELHDS